MLLDCSIAELTQMAFSAGSPKILMNIFSTSASNHSAKPLWDMHCLPCWLCTSACGMQGIFAHVLGLQGVHSQQ